MWIKICGNTNLEDARLAAELGADALGFIFASSRRQVSPAQAREIIAGLPSAVEKVGVFTTGRAGEIAAVALVAGLTAVQLHMPLQTELLHTLRAQLGDRVRSLQVVTLQVDSLDPASELQRFQLALQEALAHPELFAVLIDAARGGASGGLGVPIDWKAAAGALQAARQSLPPDVGPTPHIILAGGLRPENVTLAVGEMEPWSTLR